MIFGEYIAHDPAVPLQLFRHHGRQDWTGDGDVMARIKELTGGRGAAAALDAVGRKKGK